MTRSAGRLACLARLARHSSSSEMRRGVRTATTKATKATTKGGEESEGRAFPSTWTVPLAGAGLLAYWWASPSGGADDGDGDGGREVTLVDDRGADAVATPDRGADAVATPDRGADAVATPDGTNSGGDPRSDVDPQVSEPVTVLDSRIINELLSGGNGRNDGDINGDNVESPDHVDADEAWKPSEASERSETISREADEVSKPSEPNPSSTTTTPTTPNPLTMATTTTPNPSATTTTPTTPNPSAATTTTTTTTTTPNPSMATTTTSALIALSNEQPFCLADEDLDYASRLKQAEADAHVIALVRRSIDARHEGLLSATARLRGTLGSLEAMQQELLLAQSKVRCALFLVCLFRLRRDSRR